MQESWPTSARSQIISERLNGGEPVHAALAARGAASVYRLLANRNISGDIGTARPRVCDQAALIDGGIKGQSRAVCSGVGSLPTTKEQIRHTTSVPQERLASAHWQIIDHTPHHDLIPIVWIGPPSQLRINVVVSGIVGVGVREGVVGQELKPVA